MDQHILRLNEFFVEGGKQNLSHVLLHITEPSTPEETLKGYFFALCEVNNGTAPFITKLQEMIDRAENEYYEVSEEAGGKNAFELVLEKMNGESYVFEKEQGIMNCIVGAIRQKEIIFSYFGNPHLLLFYKNKNGLYERMDLIKNNGGEEPETNSSQLFSQIIQGKLSPSDYLFVGTPHIIDFFSHDRLEKIITARSAQQSAQHLEKVLGDLRNGYSFGGMIIHLFKPEIQEGPKKPKVVQGSSSRSLQNLFNREQATANTLSPSLLPKLDKIKDILGGPAAPQRPTTRIENTNAEINAAHLSQHRPTRRIPDPNLGDRMAVFGKGTWTVLKVIGNFFLHILIILYTFIYNIFRSLILLGVIIVNYKNRRTTIIESWKQSWRGHKQNFIHLPITTKLMLVSSMILATGFVVSLIYIRHRQAVQANDAAFNSSVQVLLNYKNSIDGAIVYKNDELAYAEYQKAEALLPQMKCESKEQKNICTNLKNDLGALAVRLRKITMVSTTPLTKFAGLINSPTGGIIRVKNKLFAYSNETSTIYSYDLLSGETKDIVTYPTIFGFTEAATPKENDYILFLFNKKQMVRLDPSDSSYKLVDISFPSDVAKVAAFVIYNRRLYSLDSQSGTIYRHDTIKTGFSQGQDWLKDRSVSVVSGTDMTIDGDLFVARDNGQVIKFTSGVSQSFTLTGLDPAFSTSLRLWTYTDVPYLYILEPAKKRLVIFEKNGHLIGQYMSQSFTNPTGFSIDYATKTAYILDSGKLLKFTLPN
jgi:hypothetical protein